MLNAGKTSVTLQLLGRTPTADFTVADSDGRQVWSLLRGQVMLGALRLYPLAAGKRLRWTHTWDQRSDAGKLVPPGDYLVRGVLLTDAPGGRVSHAVRVQIVP